MKNAGGLALAVIACFGCAIIMIAPFLNRGISPDAYAVPAGACVNGLLEADAQVPATVAEACARIRRENEIHEQTMRERWAMGTEEIIRERTVTQTLGIVLPVVGIAAAVGVAAFAVFGLGVFGSNWVRTRSMQIRPGPDGQMPLVLSSQAVLERGADGRWYVVRRDTVHDANRALGDTTTIATPMFAPTPRVTEIAQPVAHPALAAGVVKGHQAVQVMAAAANVAPATATRVRQTVANVFEGEDAPIEGESRTPRRFYLAEASGETKQIAGEASASTPPELPAAKPVVIG